MPAHVMFFPLSSWTVITENTLRRIRHYCTPLQIVRQKPNVKITIRPYNSVQMSIRS